MLPGKSVIRACTECKGTLTQATLQSGNTFGGRFWTDGWRNTPMLPLLPWLVECPHCHAMVWLDELPVVDEVDWDVPASAPRACVPALDRIEVLAKEQSLTREQEIHARRCLWWAWNHPRRDNPEPIPLSDRERVNLLALFPLIDGRTGEGRISRGEILRELGEFVRAKEVLSRKFNERLEPVARFIRDEIDTGRSSVAELWSMPRTRR